MGRRYYANSAPQQTLLSSITSSATSCTINGSFAGWPTQFPFFATLDLGGVAEEIVSVTGITGAVATIVRGQDGTSALAHSAGATIDQTVVRQDVDEANAHINATSGVHGVAGTLVDTSSAQTLTNKTLTSPVVNGGTINTATVAGGTAQKVLSTGDNTTAAVRAKAVAGGRALETEDSTGAAKLTVDGDTGNVSTPGTLASGAQTVTGGVTASGTVQGATVTATGALNGASAAVSGNATVGGSVTGGSVAASGNGTVAGVLLPKSYTNEAAATSALPSPATGTEVYLTAPTGGADAGKFAWDGSAWHRTSPVIKRSTVSYTHHSGGASDSTSVNFGYTFPTAPTVILQSNSTGGAAGGDGFTLAVNNPTTTGFTLRSTVTAGSAPALDHTWNITFVAIGQQ